MTKRQFVLIVVDRDAGEFTVEGPISDDRPWNSAVVNAQRIGRDIGCFGLGDLAPNAAAAEWQASAGGRRLAAGSIVWASKITYLNRGSGSFSAPIKATPPGRPRRPWPVCNRKRSCTGRHFTFSRRSR